MKTETIETILGNSLEIMKIFPDNYFDATITDPPFGIGFQYETKEQTNNPETYWTWLEPFYKEIFRVTKLKGFIAIWQAQLNFPYFWKWFGEKIHIYISAKNFIQLRKTAIQYAYDPIIIQWKNKPKLLEIKPKRNLDFFVCNTALFVTQTNSLARQHPCPRPIDQCYELIQNFTNENDLILDPFLGSGSIALAAKHLNRKFTGIEISETYLKLADERIQTENIDYIFKRKTK